MTEAGVLREDVKDFVREWILTPAHLDTIVTLYGEPERVFTAGEIAAKVSGAAPAIEAALAEFEAGRLVRRVDESSYQYAAAGQLRTAVERLIDAYNRIPVQLLRAVYNRPPTSLRSFSDAFRIQKPK